MDIKINQSIEKKNLFWYILEAWWTTIFCFPWSLIVWFIPFYTILSDLNELVNLVVFFGHNEFLLFFFAYFIKVIVLFDTLLKVSPFEEEKKQKEEEERQKKQSEEMVSEIFKTNRTAVRVFSWRKCSCRW